jgi:SH3-like domain-containing protein
VKLPRGATCLLFAFLVSCGKPTVQSPVLGEAFVGPVSLNIRQELSPKAAVTATVKHGDKLEILEYKRRFVRIRTPQGAEGWADTHQLLVPQQMAELRRMADNAAKAISQGTASAYEPLNMHTEANRASPSFWQIAEGAKVDVIDHTLTPRTQAAQVSSPVAPPKPVRATRRRKEKAQPKIPPPPPPPAPKPPENWLELSVPKEEAPEPVKAEDAAPIPMDDWSLVRTKDGKAGWVLTRMLVMAIPDDVAQYAEGHRITSFFPLGHVQDGDLTKENWLWTTITKGLEPYEFDSFRVFVWSRKHHRYETAYIERRVVGHFPVSVNSAGASPSFAVIVEGNDDRFYRKTYSFEGYRIHMVSRELYEVTRQVETPKPVDATAAQSVPKNQSWTSKMKDKVKGLVERFR